MRTKKIVILFILGVLLLSANSKPAFAFQIGILPGDEGTGTCQDIVVRKTEPKPLTGESKGLEVRYPSFGGVVPVATGKNALPTFVKYIFYLAIAISGFIALGTLVYGGLRYLTSAGNPSAMDEAKSRIIAGFLGVTLLLFSFLLLGAINPQLTTLKLEKVKVDPIEKMIGLTAGLYLLGNLNDLETIEVGDKVVTIRKHISTLSSIPALAALNFDNKTEAICTNPDFKENLFFSAVLHTEENYKGKCSVFYNKGYATGYLGGGTGQTLYKVAGGKITGSDVSSVTVFTTKTDARAWINYSGDSAVRLYKHSQFFDDPGDPNDVCTVPAKDITTKTPIGNLCPGWRPKDVSSLKVSYGWVLATFGKNKNGEERCEIFGSQEVPELRTHYIGQCNPAAQSTVPEVGTYSPPSVGFWDPCLSEIAVFKGSLQ